MKADHFLRLTRNIISSLQHVDPHDIFPADSQSEQRLRFRDDPYNAFLRAPDNVQSAICERIRGHLEPVLEAITKEQKQ